MRGCWRHKWKLTGSLLVLGFLLLNFLAHRQVHGLTHFAGPEDPVTPSIEELSLRQKLQVIVQGVSIAKPRNTRDPGALGLEFETRHFPGYNGETLEAWHLPGSGNRTVLLFHGYCAAKEDMLDTARVFHDWGYTALLVDFYGSGGSTGFSTGIGYTEAEDIAASVNWVLANLPAEKRESLILYGRSMGGAALSRACAQLNVTPSAIVLESVFPAFRETVAQRFKLMNLPAFPGADLLLFWGGREIGTDPWRHNPADYARAISCPALILAGTRDSRIPVEGVEVMAQNFRGPAQLHFFEAGHVAFQRTHPELWEERLRDFLKSL